jgi:hypothetical protein
MKLQILSKSIARRMEGAPGLRAGGDGKMERGPRPRGSCLREIGGTGHAQGEGGQAARLRPRAAGAWGIELQAAGAPVGRSGQVQCDRQGGFWKLAASTSGLPDIRPPGLPDIRPSGRQTPTLRPPRSGRKHNEGGQPARQHVWQRVIPRKAAPHVLPQASLTQHSFGCLKRECVATRTLCDTLDE